MKSQHELHSPVFEGLAVLAEVAAEEVAPSQGMGRGGLLPGGCDSELKLTGTHFSKVSSRNRQCRLSSYFSKEVIFKSTWEVPPPPSVGRLREGSRRYSLLPGHNGIPEGWRPHRSGRKPLPPPGRGKSDEIGTICQIFQERSAQEYEQHTGQLR